MKGKVKFILPSLALAAVVVGVTAVSAQGLTPEERLESLTSQIKGVAENATARGDLTTDAHGESVYSADVANEVEGLRQQASDAISETVARPASERAAAITSMKNLLGSDVSPKYESTSRSSYDYDTYAEFYRVGPDYFEVDMQTNKVIQFGPAPMKPGDTAKVYNTEAKFSKEDLEAKAQDFIAKNDPDADLGSMEASVGEKLGTNFFFRWTDSSKKVGEDNAFVQVGLTTGGDLLSYTNTLSL